MAVGISRGIDLHTNFNLNFIIVYLPLRIGLALKYILATFHYVGLVILYTCIIKTKATI